MAVRKSALGKGVENLIPAGKVTKGSAVQEALSPDREEKIPTTLKITEIEPGVSQPRKEFEQDSLGELAESIKEHGIIQPIVVQKGEHFYRIIAGERRWRAAKLAGLKEVPVIIKDYTEKEALLVALIENVQREDLNPIEEAMAYKRLMEEYGLTQEETAEKVAKSRSNVTNMLRLLKLGTEVQQMLAGGELSTGHARALLALENQNAQLRAAQKVVSEGLSVRETERLVKNMIKGQEQKKETEQETEQEKVIYQELEEKLKLAMGTKVVINRKKNGKGKIEIDYYSADELERLMEKLMG